MSGKVNKSAAGKTGTTSEKKDDKATKDTPVPAKPAPVALAIVDGDEAHAVTLDANFDEDWGDSLTLTPVLVHGKEGAHTVEIRLISGDSTMPSAFELISVIVSEK